MRTPLRIDLDRREVFVAGSEVELSPKEYAVLAFLFVNRKKAHSRSTIGLQIGYAPEYLELSPRIVDAIVARLRRRLNGSRGAVKTVGGLGYSYGV